ncbi:MAG: hypothetical protein BJ554DRAFT_6832 [Olpidium bornovanus]|uniref:Uncharacterized protein n=1 Tax=Olpidium bornovanus TaxID=278681 RepID=A0A8H7ZXZ4_9FUNG|nr:MAG: hypothetical protein BJ554DRAFT_6832 [Olpidium bornovanus]
MKRRRSWEGREGSHAEPFRFFSEDREVLLLGLRQVDQFASLGNRLQPGVRTAADFVFRT